MKIGTYIKIIALACLSLLLSTGISFGYRDDYPPYEFKDGPPPHLKAELLVDLNKHDYKSEDGSIIARLKDTGSGIDFLLKEGKYVLVSDNIKEAPTPRAVYRADLDGDGDGLTDFVVFNWYGGCGIEMNSFRVDIFLKKKTGGYREISYDTLSSGLEDFVDMNKDGKYEVIITDIYSGQKHTYFSYNIYEFEDYRLVNADKKFKGFPKFIWDTDKPNDKDTTHLTRWERLLHTKAKDGSICYEDIHS